jgi:putative ABC transport system permease protein
MIPLKYNVRNMRVRWVNTTMTVLGTALVVWSSCILFGLVDGLQHSLKVSGDPLDLIVLRKGATNETSSGFEKSKADDLATLGGIARDESGQPLVASELLNIPIAERLDGSRTNIIVRGVSAASPKLRPAFTILPGGRNFEPGKGECIVSRNLSRRFKGAAVGGTLQLGEGKNDSFRVVGLFTAGGSDAESEVWVDIKDLERTVAREGSVSSVQLRAASADDFQAMRKTIETQTQFLLRAVPEAQYFADQSMSSVFLKGAGTLIAVFLTFGAMFASANTMFAAVSARTREIGTMRALGFTQFDILISFLGESILLCALGGAVGLLATIPLSALTFGTSDFNSFAEKTIAFRFGPLVISVALIMTFAMGIFGGLFPALRAVRLDVITALREL